MMRSIVSAAIILLCNPVFAADSAGRESPVWSGPYLGIELGHAWASGDYLADAGTFTVVAQRNLNGPFVGAYGGYNFDLGRGIVLGIEADAALHDRHDEGRATEGNGNPSPAYIVANQYWSASARMRAGYSIGALLPFVAGGISATRLNVMDTGEHNKLETSTDNYVGWTVGAGVDYALTDHFMARIEYRYTDFGRRTLTMFGGPAFDFRSQDIRLGAAYKF